MVARMQKDLYNSASYSSLSREYGYSQWSSSLDWLLATANLDEINRDPSNSELSHQKVHQYKVLADLGISQIQDPLWKRVCIDILNILGPVAFKDFWKINFLSVSLHGKKAHLACPSQSVAESIQKYHFVIVEALKKYYPSLFSIETQVC